jgi:hypothetical protein
MNRTTPDVHNQRAQLTNYNLFSSHSALIVALSRAGATSEHEPLVMLGAQLQI